MKQYGDGFRRTAQRRIKQVTTRFESKKTDPELQWSDERLYSSELVWKVYHEALGVKLCELREIDSYQPTGGLSRYILQMQNGYQNSFTDRVVSPDDIFHSDKLFEVIRD